MKTLLTTTAGLLSGVWCGHSKSCWFDYARPWDGPDEDGELPVPHLPIRSRRDGLGTRNGDSKELRIWRARVRTGRELMFYCSHMPRVGSGEVGTPATHANSVGIQAMQDGGLCCRYTNDSTWGQQKDALDLTQHKRLASLIGQGCPIFYSYGVPPTPLNF
jgi:hypothetical protein